MNTRSLPKINWRYFLAAITMLAAIPGYYLKTWHTLEEFSNAIDYQQGFMQDFASHYYPVSQQIFTASSPAIGYLYSSFFALLLHPICTLNLSLAIIVWGAIQAGCILLLCVATKSLLKLSVGRTLIFAGLLLTSFPLLHNISWGQVSILLVSLVVTAFACYQSGWRVFAGVLLAVPVTIKFYPALFAFYFVAKRDVRACIAFSIAVLIFYCIGPVLLLGLDRWLNFERTIFFFGSILSVIPLNEDSQYIANVVSRWLKRAISTDARSWQAMKLAGYGVVVACLVMVLQLQRKLQAEKYALPLVALFACTPFFVRTSWPHYFVYLPLGQLALLCYCRGVIRRFDIAALLVVTLPIVSAIISSIFFFNRFQDWQTYNGAGMLFVSNILLLIALFLVALFNDGFVKKDL